MNQPPKPPAKLKPGSPEMRKLANELAQDFVEGLRKTTTKQVPTTKDANAKKK